MTGLGELGQIRIISTPQKVLTPFVGDQYFNQFGVRFYSGNPSFPLHTSQACGTCSTTSLPNFITTKPNDSGIVNVEFAHPVSNLTFYMIGVDVFFDPFAVIDVYRSGSLYASYPVFGNGTRTVGFTFGSLDNISKVVVRNITDPFGIGFDDFTFNVPSDIKITSARVSGYLNGTTQNALLGGNIALQATPLPGGFAGGTYSWSFTGPHQPLTGTTSSSVTIRSTAVTGDPGVGPITATVSYNKNGLIATASVTINSVLPTLTRFTGQATSNRINAPGQCTFHNGPDAFWWWYELGCPNAEQGMSFIAHAQAPQTFISDPSQSGIKFVQAISTFQKRMDMGLRCLTGRTSEGDIASGWQLDVRDPMSIDFGSIRYFSGALPGSGNTIGIGAEDSPGSILTGSVDYHFRDSLYEDDRLITYVVYFTGDDAAHPPLQRPIGKLAWNWGALVVFDEVSPNSFRHRIRFSTSTTGLVTGEASTAPMVTMHGNWVNNVDAPCAGGPALTNKHIDSTRVQVRYYYSEILGRSPDPGGWDYHTSPIAQCLFDVGCNNLARSHQATKFFFSPEFINQMASIDPVMMHPPGTPGFNAAEYNPRFVFWCYMKLLRRNPFETGDEDGFNYHLNFLNTTGDYGLCVKGFIYSPEYRDLIPHP